MSLRWTLKRGATVRSGDGWTNAAGEMTLPGSEPCLVRVWSNDDDWSLPDEEFSCTPETPAVVHAARSMTLMLLVVLADGAPFAGEATLMRKSGAQTAWRREIVLDGVSPAKVRGVPPKGDLSLRVRKSVPGYDAQTHAIARADISEGRTLVITLKQGLAREEGFLEIDFSNLDWSVTRIEFAPPGKLMGGSDLQVKVGKTLWRSKPWPVGQYIVRISGRGYWESRLVEIRPNETTTVIPDSYLPASISVTVLDEDGKPLSDAVLRLGTAEYISFHFRPMPQAGLTAIADSLGNAELTGLRAGEHKFQVAANGYEPQVISVILTDGEQHGRVRVFLARARGSIEIKLVGMREGQTCFLVLSQPGPASVLNVTRNVPAMTTYDRLAFRGYSVAVAAGKGGPVVTASITLSAEQPHACVELDVSKLEPSTGKKQ